jgi:catecholate siderophore receptor
MLIHAIPMLLLALDASPRAVKLAELGSEIVVTALHERRSNESATKTDTPLQNIPQTISVIDSRQIADQSMRSIQDVLRYVPGVALSGGEGHRDQIVVRGNGSTADFFVDGLRDDVQYYRGLYNLDRVEVLKGPNAMIFGRGGGGGVVNRVTKRPERARIARGTVSLDERGAWYGEADLNSPFGERFSARANAVYEEFNNFRDAYKGYRIGLNPTLALTPNAATRIDVGFEYAADRRVVDRGLPSDGGRPLTGFDRTFFGDTKLNRTRFTGKVGTARFEHRFTDRLKLVSKALYGDYDKFYRNVLAATPVTTVGGVRRVGLEAYQSPTTRRRS